MNHDIYNHLKTIKIRRDRSKYKFLSKESIYSSICHKVPCFAECCIHWFSVLLQKKRRTRANWFFWKIYSNIFHYILDCNNNNSTPPSSNRFSVDVGEISILRFLLISGSSSCNLIELDRFKNLAQLGPHLYSSVQITLLQKSARNWVQCFLKYF